MATPQAGLSSSLGFSAFLLLGAAAIYRGELVGFDGECWTLIALGLVCLAKRLWRTGTVRSALLEFGIALVGFAVACLVVAASIRLLAGRGAVSLASQIVAASLSVLGFPSTVSETGVAIVTLPDEVIRVAPTAFDLGVPAILGAFTGLVGVCWLERGRPRLWALTAAAVGLFVLASVRCAIGVVVNGLVSGYFVVPTAATSFQANYGFWSLLSLLVCVPVARVAMRSARQHARARAVPKLRWRLVPVAMSVFAGSLLVYAWRMPGVGGYRGGRILVDDSHVGLWQLGGVRFDKRWRGDMSVYAMSASIEALGARYLIRPNRDDRLTTDLLRDHEIVVLKVPDRPYSPAEQQAILDFVTNGGGLLAIGDHTDLFGCNSHLNEVLHRVGIRFRATSATDWRGGRVGVSQGWGHPWLETAVKNLGWLTGCDIELSGRARPALVWRCGYADEAIYANSSNFGDRFCEPAERCGPLVLAATARLGSGRIVAIGDGTVFTNFAVNRPGRYELLERALAILNRKPRRNPHALLLSGVCALVAFLIALRGLVSTMERALALALATVSIWGGWVLVEGNAATSLRALPPLREMPTAAFLGEKAFYHLAPTIGNSRMGPSLSYDSLFVEIERFGFQPRWRRTLRAALAEDRAIVIPNVLPEFTGEDLQELRAWVDRGGVLLALASNIPATHAGLQQVAGAMGVSSVSPGAGAPSGAQAAADRQTLGESEAILDRTEATEGGRLVCWRIGRGLFALGLNGQAFSRQGMGHPFPEPTQKTKPKYTIVGELFDLWAKHCGVEAQARFAVARR